MNEKTGLARITNVAIWRQPNRCLSNNDDNDDVISDREVLLLALQIDRQIAPCLVQHFITTFGTTYRNTQVDGVMKMLMGDEGFMVN